MAFQQGLAGLSISGKAIEVTSNNIANTSTVGFKASQAHFNDVYAASLTGASANQAGIGAAVSTLAQQFTQGTITATSNPLDLAINGQGFYQLENNGASTFARNGQFKVDKNGFIVNDQGFKLTGYLANALGVVVPSTPAPIVVSASDLAPNATTAVTATLNLDSRSPALPAVPAFNSNDPSTYTSSTALTAYDSLGNSHNFTMFFRKTAPNTWDLYTNLDGGASVGPTTLTFNSNGALTSPLVGTPQSFAVTTGAASPLTFTVAFPATSQFGNTFGVNQLTQDGYTTGRLSGLNVSQDGIVQGRYTNGQSRSLGQITLANFTNPNGLSPIGNNQWTESATSGPPLVGQPNTGRLGVIQAAAVEESNTDLTAELVNLITQQRNYQANAQSIRTQDQVLNTLVNLR